MIIVGLGLELRAGGGIMICARRTPSCQGLGIGIGLRGFVGPCDLVRLQFGLGLGLGGVVGP